jgi:alpha-tubulin suppressor-like RCC1 family protein
VFSVLIAFAQALHGQLGLGSQMQAVHPTLVTKFAGKSVSAVRCGEHHTLVVVEGSLLFASGSNLHGQLGFGDLRCRMSFQEVRRTLASS